MSRDLPHPLIVAHRGASGVLPEHTIEAYDLAISQGADFIEPDVVSTRDGVLVARHENEIGATTDAGARFPERRRTAIVDGRSVEGWFVEDFTFAELQTLRARERLATRSHGNDGRFLVPSLDDVLALVRRRERETGRTIGVYPETKHPSYFRSLSLPLEDKLLETLDRHGFARPDDAVFIQSFETANLRALRQRTTIRLIQLIERGSWPADLAAAEPTVGRDPGELLLPHSLAEIAAYAFGIGVEKSLVLPTLHDGRLGEATSLVTDAHAAGLAVHVWTLRSDPPFLPAGYNGDPAAEWRRFAALGVDGMFGDFPDVGVAVRRAGWA
ncbi:MAG: Glycerophosphodiester phosphodiesterase, periplasmic [Gemmatimonadaceae bacterium]|nr:Glycerophosphodiester phosphodiesterase, periplasmic [Gemmatimonadaceae bacterium]